MKSKFFIIYKHGLEEEIQWPEGWGWTCRGNLGAMLQEVLKVNAIASELKGFWNDRHRRDTMSEYSLTHDQLESYVRSKTGSLHFQSRSTRDRAMKALFDMGATELAPVDTYREVLTFQAHFHDHGVFPASQRMIKGAILSECGKYRYRLWRIWDESKPKVLFVMHNPSKADDRKDDPTITRCIAFARSWGYGGLYVGNLFAYRATDPKELKGKEYLELNPPAAAAHVLEMMAITDLHVFAYGNPIVPNSAPMVDGDHTWHYLELTKAGHPGHPLYLKSQLKPKKFTPNAESKIETRGSANNGSK